MIFKVEEFLYIICIERIIEGYLRMSCWVIDIMMLEDKIAKFNEKFKDERGTFMEKRSEENGSNIKDELMIFIEGVEVDSIRLDTKRYLDEYISFSKKEDGCNYLNISFGDEYKYEHEW